MVTRTEKIEVALSRADLQEAAADWLNNRAPFDLSVEPSDIFFRDEDDGMVAADGYVFMLQTSETKS